METTIDQNRVIELTAKVAALEAIYQNYLSWAALTVAILTIVIALAAIISFAYFRHMAAGIAERTATEIAEAAAERMANDCIQKMWPSFVAHYHAYEDAMADDDIADRISEAQPDEGSHWVAQRLPDGARSDEERAGGPCRFGAAPRGRHRLFATSGRGFGFDREATGRDVSHSGQRPSPGNAPAVHDCA